MLGFLNFFICQFLFFRITQTYQNLPYEGEVPLMKFGILWGVVPLTGWDFLPWKKMVYLVKREQSWPGVPFRHLKDHYLDGYSGYKPVEVMDLSGPGGAPINYRCWINPDDRVGAVLIRFQNGDPNEIHNGLTHEQLISMVIDRMRGFQSGMYANPYNAKALEHFEAGLSVLQERTKERISRGVEGKRVR